MSKILVLVSLYSVPEDSGCCYMDVFPEKCFLTEESALKWVLSMNPSHPEWFEYTSPDEGELFTRCYAIDYIVLEEE